MHKAAIAATATSLLAILASCTPSQALAAETSKFSYDAKGRLLKVERTGGVNNGVTAQYTHDRANNRKTLIVTGSPNPPQP